ncbi:2-keto-4-pentenoate hydratase [Xanthobacter agilis]|uniref:2-keto-4-pentenoate hydratase n=1 Tax=Xanthobacter agilis TaxID=47492 RepID=A0ABU0LDC9_XANAG|nr:fumarylacetoacetate hydrolase family protein [Xanthobacter agilis]MDQ0505149.1 2-keto-4-pentenoate hydratase [Xanthobacter agilis]
MSDVNTGAPAAEADVAERLRQAGESRVPCAPVAPLLSAGDLDAAYRVQEIGTRRALSAGRVLVGRKIGLTSKAVQKQLGVDQPDYGMLFDDMAVPDGWEIPSGRLIQPKVEAEVAFVLGRDLCAERLTLADVLGAVDYAVAAIEVVDSRIADWRIGIVDTIADNASSGLYVLGNTPRRLDGLDLLLAGMVMTCRGNPVSVGVGAACLGHPLNAVWWLARTMARAGRPLRAGDTVLSGALGPMVAVTAGETYEAQVMGLGMVRATFAPEA